MPRLARLDDFKAYLGTTETSSDALLWSLLERASARAAGGELAGRDLGYIGQRIEYPLLQRERFLWLDHFPVHSIASIKSRYHPSTSWDDADVLVEDDDWFMSGQPAGDARNRGMIEFTRGARRAYLRVEYAAGFHDPGAGAGAEDVSFSDGIYDAVTAGGVQHVVVAVGAFTSYTHTLGDVLVLASGTGLDRTKPTAYRIAERLTADTIRLLDPVADGDLATGDLTTAAPSSLITPPADLQQGVLLEALQMWNHHATGGVADVDLAGGGSIRSTTLNPHVTLVDAARRLRRMWP